MDYDSFADSADTDLAATTEPIGGDHLGEADAQFDPVLPNGTTDAAGDSGDLMVPAPGWNFGSLAPLMG